MWAVLEQWSHAPLQRACVEEEEDDNPFPTMPELTGTYNFSFQGNVAGNQPVNTKSFISKQSSLTVTHEKENIHPGAFEMQSDVSRKR